LANKNETFRTKQLRRLSTFYNNVGITYTKFRETYEAEERENENRLLNVELASKKTLQRYLLGGLILFAILSALIALALRKNRMKKATEKTERLN
jgi:hypothetical protein